MMVNRGVVNGDGVACSDSDRDEAFAAARPSQDAAAWPPSRRAGLEPVQAGEGQGWLWFGGRAGGAARIRTLARSLCPGRQVRAFAWHGHDEDADVVVEAAVEAVLAAGERRPRIVGEGDGCWLAWAIAVALAGRNVEVELLVLVDPPALPASAACADVAVAAHADSARGTGLPWFPGGADPEPWPGPLCLLSLASAGLAPDEAARWRRLVPEGRFATAIAGTAAGSLDACVTLVAGLPRTPPRHASLVTLQSGRSGGERYVCIPGAGDNVVAFFDLVGELGADAHVVGLQPRGLHPHEVPHASISAAVEVYLDALGALPAGAPIHLVGHSFGGWVALALAARLHASSCPRPLASLTIIDSEPPDELRRLPALHAVVRRWVEILGMGASAPLAIDPEQLRGMPLRRQLAEVHRALVAAGVLPPRTPAEALHGPFRMFKACLRARDVPSCRYEGKVALVCFDDPRLDDAANAQRYDSWQERWSRQLPNASAVRAGGNHVTGLKRPHVRALVDTLWPRRR